MTSHEHELQSAILDYLALRGAVALRVNSGGFIVKGESKNRYVRGAPAGTSDIIACYKGRYIAIEVKWGDNKPTDAQYKFAYRVRTAGGIAIFAYSLDKVVWLLDEMDREVTKEDE